MTTDREFSTDPGPTGSDTSPHDDIEWDSFEREFADWGRQLDLLRSRTDTASAALLSDLERRHNELQEKAHQLRIRTEQQLAETKEQIEQRGQEAGADVSQRVSKAKETAVETMKETGEKLGKGAEELREGFGRAWSELRAAFESAADQFQDNTSDPDDPKSTT